MPEQLIAIDDLGEISGLQVKPGKGVDLREFGRAEITRASDIVFDVPQQRWSVQLATGKYRGLSIGPSTTYQLLGRPGEDDLIEMCWKAANIAERHTAEPHVDRALPYYFDDYDTAVAFEVDFLNLMRSVDPDCFICEA